METADSVSMIPLEDIGNGGGPGDSDEPSTPIPSNGIEGTHPKRTRMLNIKRRVYTRDEVNRSYPVHEEAFSIKTYLRGKCRCSLPRAQKMFLGYVPIVSDLYNYYWRKNILTDFTAGVCVAFLHIPQGLALGLLASLPPVYGLYASFFPILFYMIFGTSRHTSMGTNALISLLIAGIIDTQLKSRAATQLGVSITTIETTTTTTADQSMTTSDPSITLQTTGGDTTTEEMLKAVEDDLLRFKVGVASSVGLLSGLYLTAAGLLKLGFLTRYFSSAFLGGFTTSVAVHIVVSQLSKLINVQIGVHSGSGKLMKIVVDVFQNMGNANPADVIISVISLTFLLLVTICVNERFKAKLKVPIPVQLILVAITTIISHVGHFERDFGVAVVGDVPSGIPMPTIPNPGAYPGVATESIVVAILTYTISISLGKLTAKMNDYEIDDNQEFIAYGLTNTLSSFFSCFTSCNNPPRAMVLSGVGARSTFHAVFSAILILIVLLAAGPLFQSLPVAVLAAMICAALKNILLQVTQLPTIWRTSKPDFIVWVLTCLISTFVDLDIGIVAGILISFLTIIVKSQITSGSVGAYSTSEDLIHLDGNKRRGVTSADHFVIFYFPSPLHFANAERFKKELFSKTFNPNLTREEKEKESNNYKEKKEDNGDETVEMNSEKLDSHLLLKYIILDCSGMTYVDMDGGNMLKTVHKLYFGAGVRLLLTNCSDEMLDRLDNVGYFKNIKRKTVFFDIYDAVSFAQESTEIISYDE